MVFLVNAMNRGPRQLSFPALANVLDGMPSDAELVTRYAATRDQAAFELLLRRHAAQVIGHCRRLLTDANDVDDAFQATFLVLARKAGTISRRESVAGWLRQIARRAALRVRADRDRYASRNRTEADELLVEPNRRSDQWELRRALDEEISRLPARHRSAFILCCLEGKTGEEAARLLGCPPGTVSSRLTRARERLRQRLARRGFAPAGVISLAFLGESDAAPSAAIIQSTLSASLPFANGQFRSSPPARSAVIAKGVIRAMVLEKCRSIPLVLAGLFLAGAVWVATGLGANPQAPPPEKEQADKPKSAPGLPAVKVVQPKPGGLDRIAELVCNVDAAQKTDLFAQATGTLKSVSVSLGDRVKAGQVMAEIDFPDLALGERQSAVLLAQAESLLKESLSGVAMAQADVESALGKVKQRDAELTAAQSALDYRKKQFDRMKSLFDTKAIDSKVLDEAEGQVQSAKAQVETAKSGIETAKADVNLKKAKLVQAEAAVETARANVESAKLGLEKAHLSAARAKITAPFDGVVTRCGVSGGESVRGDLAGQPLLTIMRTDLIRISVDVPEHHVSLLRIGLPAEISFDALPDFREMQKVARVGFAVDPANRTIRAEFDVNNRDGRIRPGMGGSAVIQLGGAPADAVRIPITAVFRFAKARSDGATHGVYVYREGKAQRTPVRVGYSRKDEAEVTSGLKADDLVVIEPERLAGDEVPVQVQKQGSAK